MNSLQQYIDIYKSQRHVIESHSSDALNRRRQKALEELEKAGDLPQKGSEGYEKTDLRAMYAPDYGLNLTRVSFTADKGDMSLCELPSGRVAAVIVNDTLAQPAGHVAPLPAGVEVMSLAKAAKEHPQWFETEIADNKNPLVALNDLLVQDGVYVRIAPGTVVEQPIQILSIFTTRQPFMAVRRVVIESGAGSRATIMLCDHPRVHNVEYLNSRVVEINLGEGASLDIYDLEEATSTTSRTSALYADQGAGSQLQVLSVFLNGGRTRNEFRPRHRGEHCKTRISGMVIGGDNQIIDNATYLTHTYPRCHSDQLFKYALFGESQGAFEGEVTVDPGAVFTETHQTDRNLLASPKARMYAMPQLIINCDEVKASHGAATGQLDEKALFYMRSRGIPEEEARMMLIEAFMTDVLDTITHEPLRERLRHLVDRRLRGCESVCAGCHSH